MYSYLTFSIVLAAFGLAFVVVSQGRQRQFVLWSAVFAAPTGLADVWFAPAYWQPDHVIGPQFSVEGVLFSFGNGALLAFLIWPFFSTLLGNPHLRTGILAKWRNFMIIVFPGFAVFLVLWDGIVGPLPVMQASFAGFVFLCVLLILMGRMNLIAGLSGAALFSFVYWAQTVVWSWFDSDLASFWPVKASYLTQSLPLTGLPGDELIWAAFYGLLWPHIIAVALGDRMSGPSDLFRRAA